MEFLQVLQVEGEMFFHEEVDLLQLGFSLELAVGQFVHEVVVAPAEQLDDVFGREGAQGEVEFANLL